MLLCFITITLTLTLTLTLALVVLIIVLGEIGFGAHSTELTALRVGSNGDVRTPLENKKVGASVSVVI